MSKWISAIGLAALAAACAAVAPTVSNEPLRLTLGTATPGGGFTLYGTDRDFQAV